MVCITLEGAFGFVSSASVKYESTGNVCPGLTAVHSPFKVDICICQNVQCGFRSRALTVYCFLIRFSLLETKHSCHSYKPAFCRPGTRLYSYSDNQERVEICGTSTLST